MDPQTRHEGATAAGHTGGPRSDGGSGTQTRARTDLRARIRPAELRVQARTRLPRSGATGGRTLAGGPRLVRGRGLQELLRHDPTRTTDGTGPAANRRWQGIGAAGTESQSWNARRTEGMATDRTWHAAGSRDQPDPGQPVSQPTGPPNGPVRVGNGALCR